MSRRVPGLIWALASCYFLLLVFVLIAGGVFDFPRALSGFNYPTAHLLLRELRGEVLKELYFVSGKSPDFSGKFPLGL